MNIKKIFPFVITLIAGGTAMAQNDVDALRYSQTGFGSTARSLSMGGAFGALGGEISSLSNNPGGIAVYKNSEITFTPSLFSQTAQSTYLGQNTRDSKLNFNFANAGIVLTYNTENETGWKNFNFGFAYNRTENFNSRVTFRGTNSSSSLLDNYVNTLNSNGITTGSGVKDNYPSDIFLAYDTYLIDTTRNQQGNLIFGSIIGNGSVIQQRTTVNSGAVSDLSFSFGGNYNDQLYLGASLGIPSVSYNSTSTYEETDNSHNAYFKSFKNQQTLSTTGNGLNFKVGAIYRPIYWLRLGLALHTPTVYSLTDNYSNSTDAYYDQAIAGSTHYSSSSNDNYSKYEVAAPGRAILSTAFVIKKKALLSIDYEYVDYTSMSLASSNGDYPYTQENDDIQNKYRATNNVRIGGEYKVSPMFSLRAGYAYYQSPFNDNVNQGINGNRVSYTAGVGMREKGYFIDLGYALTKYQDYYQPYTLANSDVQGATTNMSISRIMMTIGLVF